MPRHTAAAAAGLLVATLSAAPSPASAQANRAAPQAKPAPVPQQSNTPAASAPAAPALSANQLALAREIVLNSGVARSFDSVIPAFTDQIRKQLVTRPELTTDLETVLASLQPEMELQKQRMVDIAARTYATRLPEADLKEIATFFRSPAGKRYVETQPQILDDMVRQMQGWTEEVSEYVMVRVRAEMGKRGHQLQ